MKKVIAWLPIFLFFFLTIFLFRQYVFAGKVPFAGNLLVSFYEPWKSYTWNGYGSNGPANKPIGFDSLRIFYPLRSLTIDSFKRFALPLWNPYDFAGNTQLATYQSAVFFPLTPLFLLLPQVDAWSFVVFLGPFLACLFTYFFLRTLSLSKKSSILGALAFGFSGGILVLSEESFMSVYSLLFLPLIFLGLYRFFNERKFRWFALIIIGIVGSILSGWFQSTLYVLTLSFVWTLFLTARTKNAGNFLYVSVAFFIAFLLSGPHIIPNIESYLYSARGTTDAKFLFDMYLLPPWHLITYFAPDFFGNPGTYNYFDNGFYYEKITYIGVVGLFLGLLSLFKLKKSSEEWFFTLIWILTVSLGVAIPTSWFFLYYLHLPLISTILPSRIFLLSAFCLSVMASYGAESLFKKPYKSSVIFASAFSIASIGLTWSFLIMQKHIDPLGNFATISYRNFILPSIFVVLTIFFCIVLLRKNQTIKKIGFTILLCLSVIGIVYFSDKYLYFSEKQFTFPPTPILSELSKRIGNDRFWSYGDGYMERNFASYFHLQSPEGYDSFYIRTYGELMNASKNGGIFTTNIPRADVQLTGISRLSEITKNQFLLKMLNLLDVKYVFAKTNKEDEIFIENDPQKEFRTIWSDGKYVLYENTFSYPRVFLSSFYAVRPSASTRIATIFSPNVDLSKEIVLSTYPGFSSGIGPVGHASITSYTPEKITIHTTTDRKTLLFLSDNNYPGWKAYVDGKQTQIFTADHTFRSIVVPKGMHQVIFMYQPVTIQLGFGSLVVGLLLFGITGLTITKRNKKS